MRWSRYNVLFNTSRKNIPFLYNSRTNSFYELDNDSFILLTAVRDGKKDVNDLEPSLINELKENKVLVDHTDDNNYISIMQYLKRKRTFNSHNLSIVLAPTLACNFACPYCYEKDLPNVSMREDVQSKFIDFINLHEPRTKTFSLYWHGGEPLIAFKSIQTILNKILEKSALPLVDHRMVSNGYLFNKEICQFFKETKLNYVQITVDGTEVNHNKNRIHKSGIATYNKIIENIDMISEEIPDCRVGVRVNIHNENKSDYPEIHRKLSERWDGKNCVVYPAFVLPQSSGCDVSCLSCKEKALFYIDLYSKYGMKQIDFTPSMRLGTCSAIYENHYVVDPMGKLYKCWADIGMPERVIGDLDSGINDWKYVSEYEIATDKFNDPKCLQCSIFPICDGGCNRFRLEYDEYGTPYDICPIDANGLEQYLEIIYEQRQEKQQLAEV